ncbi:phage tail protein [Alkalihalophilus marmarensis]|uniref:phage tail protein n=1 Tax=Alkalihalophilus marmarensis TaxID=521377 RepID=UPI002E237B54|nr:phage tail protein [Alkalihalophilus marmarensis]
MFNEGQTAVFLKDLTGKEYPAIAETKRIKRVNGQRQLTLAFLYTDINKDFMGKLEFGWKVLFGGEWYTITHPGYSTDGNYFSVNVTAVLSFFVDLNGYYLQDKAENKSFTAATFFKEVFSGTSYNYVLVSSFAANTLSFEDNQSKTQRFLYGIDRFSAEFTVRGNAVYISDLAGSDKDVILHDDLNINDVKIEVDASGFHTWARGYGDLPEGEEGDYQLVIPPYISPLAQKYGMIEGPAIKDGRFKEAGALTDAVKEQVENSYKLSTEIQAIDLTNNGYPGMILEEGDRVYLHVDRFNLNQQVRVMEVEEHFDWEGNIIDARYVVDNEAIAASYKTEQYNTLADFRDILSGKKKIGYSWLPEAVRRAAEIINGNQDSLFKYGAGEIIGINQGNPNGYMRFNTDGLGFSRNGGIDYETAMTYEGIVANAITAGELYAELVRIVGRNGLIFMDGDEIRAINPNDPSRFVQLSPNGLEIENGMIRVKGQAGTVIIDGTSNMHKILATGVMNITVPAGAVTHSASIAHNLGYTPAFSAFMQGDSTQPDEDGFSFSLPRLITQPGGDSLVVQSSVIGEATDNRFYVRVRRAQNYGSNLPQKVITIRYFIYKEVAF